MDIVSWRSRSTLYINADYTDFRALFLKTIKCDEWVVYAERVTYSKITVKSGLLSENPLETEIQGEVLGRKMYYTLSPHHQQNTLPTLPKVEPSQIPRSRPTSYSYLPQEAFA